MLNRSQSIINYCCFIVELQAAGFTNYTQQNLYEVTHLAEKFGNDKRTWVMGDLNTGPECSKYGVHEEGPGKIIIFNRMVC